MLREDLRGLFSSHSHVSFSHVAPNIEENLSKQTKVTENLETTHNWEHRPYKNSLEKSPNKQLQPIANNNNKPWEGGRLWLPELSYYNIQNVQFSTKKITKHVKK